MKEGPDIAGLAALIGDPARANILTALMSGKALTASELSEEAGVTLPTTSSHLARLIEGGMLRTRKQGRHKYFSLADDEVAKVLEALMGFAAGRGRLRHRTGPADQALRKARVCYNHLAGDLGIQLFDSLVARSFIALGDEAPVLTKAGETFAVRFGLDLARLKSSRAALCRECLDWSERRSHLAGSLGRAFLTKFEELGWARRKPSSRAVLFSPPGERQFKRAFPLPASP